MLRTSFHVAISTDHSTSEIQFGHIRRPNHHNTSWDRSRYEIPAHKWIDLSEPDYGVALMNDCKYGHRVQGNTLDLNLLRSPDYPDPVADQGWHEFTYSLLPHCGDHIRGGVIRAGYELNLPLQHAKIEPLPSNGYLPVTHGLLTLDSDNIIVESIKKAEDCEGIILRLYEAHGLHSRVVVTFGLDVAKVILTNLLEETIGTFTLSGDSVRIEFKPFEIQTLLILPDAVNKKG